MLRLPTLQSLMQTAPLRMQWGCSVVLCLRFLCSGWNYELVLAVSAPRNAFLGQVAQQVEVINSAEDGND